VEVRMWLLEDSWSTFSMWFLLFIYKSG